MEAVSGKRQLLRIRLQAAHVPDQALIDEAVSALGQHGGVDVGEQYQAIRSDLPGHACAQVPGASGHIQRLLTGSQLSETQGKPLPQRCAPADIRSFIRS